MQGLQTSSHPINKFKVSIITSFYPSDHGELSSSETGTRPIIKNRFPVDPRGRGTPKHLFSSELRLQEIAFLQSDGVSGVGAPLHPLPLTPSPPLPRGPGKGSGSRSAVQSSVTREEINVSPGSG